MSSDDEYQQYPFQPDWNGVTQNDQDVFITCIYKIPNGKIFVWLAWLIFVLYSFERLCCECDEHWETACLVWMCKKKQKTKHVLAYFLSLTPCQGQIPIYYPAFHCAHKSPWCISNKEVNLLRALKSTSEVMWPPACSCDSWTHINSFFHEYGHFTGAPKHF